MTPIFIPMYATATISTWQEAVIVIYYTISLIVTLDITGSILIAILLGWLIFPFILIYGAVVIICEIIKDRKG